jgi:cytochrome c-type biogenesis protein CcmF
MILTWLGRAALYVCFIGAIGGVVEQALAIRRHRASRALWWAGLSVAGIVGAVGVMEFALITHSFALAYVAENNATFTPLLYSITGLWSALEGSLMLWVLLQSAITLGVLIYYGARSPKRSWAGRYWCSSRSAPSLRC